MLLSQLHLRIEQNIPPLAHPSPEPTCYTKISKRYLAKPIWPYKRSSFLLLIVNSVYFPQIPEIPFDVITFAKRICATYRPCCLCVSAHVFRYVWALCVLCLYIVCACIRFERVIIYVWMYSCIFALSRVGVLCACAYVCICMCVVLCARFIRYGIIRSVYSQFLRALTFF